MTKTRIMLENLYRADTEELSRLLKVKRFLWISRDSKSGMVENSTINQFWQRICTDKQSTAYKRQPLYLHVHWDVGLNVSHYLSQKKIIRKGKSNECEHNVNDPWSILSCNEMLPRNKRTDTISHDEMSIERGKENGIGLFG